MCLNHPQTLHPTNLGPWRNCLPGKRSLAPKRVGPHCSTEEANSLWVFERQRLSGIEPSRSCPSLPRDSSSPLHAPAWNKAEKASHPAPGPSKRKGAQRPGLSPETLNRFLGKESRALGLPLAISKAPAFPSYIPPFPTESECSSLLTRVTELN